MTLKRAPHFRWYDIVWNEAKKKLIVGVIGNNYDFRKFAIDEEMTSGRAGRWLNVIHQPDWLMEKLKGQFHRDSSLDCVLGLRDTIFR